MFKDWLAGYLEGKDSLSKDEIDLIKAKAAEFEPMPYYQPISIPWVQPVEPYRWYPTGEGTTSTLLEYSFSSAN